MSLIGMIEVIRSDSGSVSLPALSGKIYRVINTHISDEITVQPAGGNSFQLGSGQFCDCFYDEGTWFNENTNYQSLGASEFGDIKWKSEFRPIAAEFPWLCLSVEDQVLDTSHFSAEYIAWKRARKFIYNETGTSPVSSFIGTWSGDTFTLDDNDSNNELLAMLAEEYLFMGSFDNFRLLNDGTNDFKITDLSATSRTITVDTTDNTPAGTSVEIYKHRVYGRTDACQHYSEAGLGVYQAGDGKFSGALRRDKIQGHYHGHKHATEGGQGISGSGNTYLLADNRNSTLNDIVQAPYTDGLNGDPRTGENTEIRSGTKFAYEYVGEYTA